MLELIYSLACSLSMYFVYLQKDSKSLSKKTLENKGEVGKRKQKRKRRKKKAKTHPRPFFPLSPLAASAQQTSSSARPNSPTPSHSFPGPQRAPPLFSSLAH